jgi:hypothetical protein
MTLLNYYVEPNRADILTDTLVSFGNMPHGFATKYLVLGHAWSTLAHRGPVDHLWGVAERLERLFYEGGVDGLVGVLPRVCRLSQAAVVARYPSHADLASELILIGWSVERRSFAAWHLESRCDFEPRPGAQSHISPGPVGWRPPKLGAAPTDAKWIEMAELQAEVMAKEARERGEPDGAHTIGGDLLLTSMTRGQIVTRKVYRFTGYEKALEQARLRNGQ